MSATISTKGLMVSLCLALVSIFSSRILPGQNQLVRCYTMETDSMLRAANPKLGTLAEFESWLQKRIREGHQYQRGPQDVYVIPVVVHVVHNGESVGSGRNISLAQIQSQIDVLNEDYRKKSGTPGYNSNPVGADTKIEFVLAKRTPSGASSNGVDRVDRNSNGWSAPPYTTSYVDAVIKPATYWDPNQYFNIWVTDLSGGILGYAQFPSYSSLAGFDCDEGAASTDGVVIGYQYFGSSDKGTFPVLSPPYDKGRTATHEVGHWLGLRHIWGDGNCSVDDFCGDTPWAAAANYGCPTGTISCSSTDMIENYMDYTNDTCMNIFTLDQTTRMRTVLENCIRRNSLLTSPALTTPVSNDAGISEIITPVIDYCSSSITPQVKLKNYGTSNLTSATIHYRVDNGTVNTYTWSGGPISTGNTATVTLSSITVTSGTHTFNAWTSSPNGSTDGNTTNDTAFTAHFEYTTGASTTWTENFDGNQFTPDNWTVNDLNNDCYTWREVSHLTGSQNDTTSAAFLYFYNYSSPSGQKDELISPAIDLTGANTATLTFDVAYARYDATTNDGLQVKLSTDCGNTYSNTIYNKSGSALSTVGNQSTSWFPTSSSHWRTETIDLNSYTGNTIRLKFVSVNDYGNNLFIDNISVTATALLPVQLIQFNGQRLPDGSITLHWKTAYEENISSYLLERSADGIHFSPAGRVNKNTGQVIASGTEYYFNDANAPKGALYYRLKQENADGAIYVLGLTQIKGQPISSAITVFPNPFDDFLSIQHGNSFQNREIHVDIINVLGRKVSSCVFDSELNPVYTLSTSGLPRGVYFIQIITGNETRVFRVIKQ